MLDLNQETQCVIKGTVEALDAGADLPDMIREETGLHSGVDPVGLLRHINLEKRKKVRRNPKHKGNMLTIALTGVIGIEDIVLSKKVVEEDSGLGREGMETSTTNKGTIYMEQTPRP